MNNDYLNNFIKSGYFHHIDIQFATYIQDLSKTADTDIFLAAAMVSQATGNGDVCLNLASAAGQKIVDSTIGQGSIECPDLEKWKNVLLTSRVVGPPGIYRPLILDPNNRLYLYRYWDYENKLAEAIKQRIGQSVEDLDDKRLKDSLHRLFANSEEMPVDWQLVAGFCAATQRFCVISGGPGTGKTATIAKILALLVEQYPHKRLKMLLAAPTGKAAARLMESISAVKPGLACPDTVKNFIPTEVFTIHRMLKPLPGSPYFQHNSENPLPADVVVVDEASMVDLALMSKLVQALLPNARLIISGDKDQLASVEAGAVMGDICDRRRIHGFSSTFCNRFQAVTGKDLSITLEPHRDAHGLCDSVVVLKKSYRFSPDSLIWQVSRAVNNGEAGRVLTCLAESGQNAVTWKKMTSAFAFSRTVTEWVLQRYSDYLCTDDPLLALERFNRFKILCALKKGPFGVEALNRHAEHILARAGQIKPQKLWYRGRPVLITRNDYRLELFNGDIGITLPAPETEKNELYVYFPQTTGTCKRFLPHRLPEHETVYATTVHKSQGSEFESILLILPDTDYEVLTRELIYTGITRARSGVTLWADQAVLTAAVSRRIQRRSGLRDALWGEGN